MKHLGTKRLETERLVLRRFTVADAEPMYRNWASDGEVTKFLTWPAHTSVEMSEMVLRDWTGHYAEESYYQWAIVPKSTREPIGSISVVSRNDRAELVHIGYCIGRSWWHRGIMSEALRAVMRKCGMKYEGTLRQSDRNNQGICDASWYGLLREERIAR